MVQPDYDTEYQAAAARRRLRQSAQTVRGFSAAPETTLAAPAPEPGESGFQKTLRKLTTPLVDVPDLPFGFVGDIAEEGIEGLTSPLGLVSAALIPVTGGASFGLRGAAGAAARLATRGAAEVVTGGVASKAAREVADRLPKGTPDSLRLALSLGAGAAGGIGASTGVSRALRSGIDQAAIGAAQAAKAAAGARTPEAGIMAEAIASARSIPRSEQRALLHQQRAAQAGRASAARARSMAGGATPSQADAAARAAGGGEFQRASFESPRVEIETVEKMRSQIDEYFTARGLEFTKFNANDGLDKILAGAVPPPAELRVLEEVFGSGLVEAVRLHRGFGSKMVEALNFPRALIATADLSAPLRQGVMLAGRHPKEWASAWKPMVKAFFDGDYYDSAVAELRGLTSPEAAIRAARADGAGLAQTAGKVLGREEPFIGMSLFGRSRGGSVFGEGSSSGLSGIMERSERAYSLFLDTLRRSTFEKFASNLDATGVKSLSTEREYAAFLNRATGRGAEKVLEGNLGKVANAAFFAPNYTMSRFLAPASLFTADPLVRKQVMQDLGGFVGTGMVALGTLAIAAKSGAIPGLSVESNPLSSDFGKIRLGAQRYDFWGGYQQIARTAAQFATGQQKSPSSGRISETDRLSVLGRFMQSKLSPAAGFGVDVTRGETFMGDRIDFTPDSAVSQAEQRLVPLSFQDMMEGYATGGRAGAVGAIPAFFGVGVTSFQSLSEIKNDVAFRLFNTKSYRDLTGPQQDAVDADQRVAAKLASYESKAGNEYGVEIEGIETKRLQGQQLFMARLASGMMDRRDFADAIEENQLRASVARDSARRNFNIPDAQDSSALQVALSAYYNLYEQSDYGYVSGVKTGQIDWDKFSELEKDLLASMTDDERAFVEARRKADHDPLVQWYFNDKEYVNDSGYYDVATTKFARRAKSIQARFPEIQSYNDLRTALDTASRSGDTPVGRRLSAILGPIQADIDSKRESMRRKDAKLDRALFELGRTSKLLTPAARRLAPVR